MIKEIIKKYYFYNFLLFFLYFNYNLFSIAIDLRINNKLLNNFNLSIYINDWDTLISNFIKKELIYDLYK